MLTLILLFAYEGLKPRTLVQPVFWQVIGLVVFLTALFVTFQLDLGRSPLRLDHSHD